MSENKINLEDMPTEINILGRRYSVEYVDNPAEVDIFKRESLWGQIDYWTRSIRIYANDLNKEDIWESIIHEVLHGIGATLKIGWLQDNANHDDLGALAVALTDTLVRNGWLRIDE